MNVAMRIQTVGRRRYDKPLTFNLPPEVDRESLFEAKRVACQALDLPSSSRMLLDQLCACFGGHLVHGAIMVWPSNEHLSNTTGLDERTIRNHIKRLIDLGLIRARDSANGKRYARFDRAGRPVEAFGFDLTPVMARLSEFKDRLLAQQELRAECRRAFDTITICRKAVESALERLEGSDAVSVRQEYEDAVLGQPRRSVKVFPRAALDLWVKLRARVDLLLEESGAAGKSDRHKEATTNAPETPCMSDEDVEAVEVLRSCPDALQVMGYIKDPMEIASWCDRYRGVLGVSRDAWMEAQMQIGVLRAGLLMTLIMQRQADGERTDKPVRNIGGYFRKMTRLVKDGSLSIGAEAVRLRGRMN